MRKRSNALIRAPMKEREGREKKRKEKKRKEKKRKEESEGKKENEKMGKFFKPRNFWGEKNNKQFMKLV
jgi:hypothetical protein